MQHKAFASKNARLLTLAKVSEKQKQYNKKGEMSADDVQHCRATKIAICHFMAIFLKSRFKAPQPQTASCVTKPRGECKKLKKKDWYNKHKREKQNVSWSFKANILLWENVLTNMWWGTSKTDVHWWVFGLLLLMSVFSYTCTSSPFVHLRRATHQ